MFDDLMDVKQLRLFELLYETRSVTAAAERLGQSQPTVSIWLAKMRRRLRDPLFIRTPRGMEPTPRAAALAIEVATALGALRTMAAPAASFSPADAHRQFRISMADASHITLMPPLLGRVRAEAPHVHLAADRIDERVRMSLETGHTHLALGFVPELQSGFRRQSLFIQDWICLCAADHPRIGRTLDMRAYAREAHVRIVQARGHEELLDQALKKHRIERRTVLELPGFLSLSTLIATTDLVATLPREIGELLAEMGGLRTLACPFPIQSFTVHQYWHSRFDAEPGCIWLRALCANLFQHRGIRKGRYLGGARLAVRRGTS